MYVLKTNCGTNHLHFLNCLGFSDKRATTSANATTPEDPATWHDAWDSSRGYPTIRYVSHCALSIIILACFCLLLIRCIVFRKVCGLCFVCTSKASICLQLYSALISQASKIPPCSLVYVNCKKVGHLVFMIPSACLHNVAVQ